MVYKQITNICVIIFTVKILGDKNSGYDNYCKLRKILNNDIIILYCALPV